MLGFLMTGNLCMKWANIPRGDQVIYNNHEELINIIP